MDKNFSQADSMRIIEEMIAQARFKPRPADSLMTLLWGYLVLVAALAHWFLLVFTDVPYAAAAWLLMIVGGVATAVMKSRSQKEQRVKTYVDKLIGQLWIAFSISFGLLFFIMQPDHGHFLPVIMLLFGVAMWLQGALLKYMPYKAGAAACWLGSAIGFGLTNDQQLLALAGAVLLGYLIPGHLLFDKTRKANV
jgi:hypothetical protein